MDLQRALIGSEAVPFLVTQSLSSKNFTRARRPLARGANSNLSDRSSRCNELPAIAYQALLPSLSTFKSATRGFLMQL